MVFDVYICIRWCACPLSLAACVYYIQRLFLNALVLERKHRDAKECARSIPLNIDYDGALTKKLMLRQARGLAEQVSRPSTGLEQERELGHGLLHAELHKTFPALAPQGVWLSARGCTGGMEVFSGDCVAVAVNNAENIGLVKQMVRVGSECYVICQKCLRVAMSPAEGAPVASRWRRTAVLQLFSMQAILARCSFLAQGEELVVLRRC